MSKNSHAKHEHKVHSQQHHVETDAEIEAAVPSFAQAHKGIVWAIIIFLIIALPLLFAALALLGVFSK